ncbi:MAG: hypothetical protein ACE5IM_01850, partial [Nitrospinota bacterium]
MVKTGALDRLRKPLEFASRNDFANVGAVAGLERSAAVWIRELEAGDPPRAVRRALEGLRRAFAGFDELSPPEKRERVETALGILDDIQGRRDEHQPKGHQPKGHQSEGPASAGLREGGEPETSLLTESVQCVRGIGPKRAETLARLGIRTIGDALFFLPRRYVDRSRLRPVSRLRPGREETFLAAVLGGGVAFFGRGRRVYEVTLGDGTGVVTGVWFAFRSAYMKGRYQPGRRFLMSGVVRMNARRGRLEVHHPEVEEVEEANGEGGEGGEKGGIRETLHAGRIVPFYPSTEGLHQRSLRSFMKKVVDGFSGRVADVLPPEVESRRGLVPLAEALRCVHFPPEET